MNPIHDTTKDVPVVGDSFKVSRVATSIKCVVNLTVQYFIVYTALVLIQTVDDVWRPLSTRKCLFRQSCRQQRSP